MKKKDKNTEQVILLAARKVFIEKGLAGSRMQDIANQAGHNKALLHYYFTSKNKLFDIVFEQEIEVFFSPGRYISRRVAFVMRQDRKNNIVGY
ncbi:MAG: helix-turn-helix domain-containing protein [Ferruginibacter sp.]